MVVPGQAPKQPLHLHVLHSEAHRYRPTIPSTKACDCPTHAVCNVLVLIAAWSYARAMRGPRILGSDLFVDVESIGVERALAAPDCQVTAKSNAKSHNPRTRVAGLQRNGIDVAVCVGCLCPCDRAETSGCVCVLIPLNGLDMKHWKSDSRLLSDEAQYNADICCNELTAQRCDGCQEFLVQPPLPAYAHGTRNSVLTSRMVLPGHSSTRRERPPFQRMAPLLATHPLGNVLLCRSAQSDRGELLLPAYALPSRDLAGGGTCLCACYAMPGTEVAGGGIERTELPGFEIDECSTGAHSCDVSADVACGSAERTPTRRNSRCNRHQAKADDNHADDADGETTLLGVAEPSQNCLESSLSGLARARSVASPALSARCVCVCVQELAACEDTAGSFTCVCDAACDAALRARAQQQLARPLDPQDTCSTVT
eukprot:2983802-Rhodomonas_salina.1